MLGSRETGKANLQQGTQSSSLKAASQGRIQTTNHNRSFWITCLRNESHKSHMNGFAP